MKRTYTAIFAVGFIFFLTPGFFRDFWTPDEPRYALVAQQMMSSGNYLVPHRNVEVYKEKPPLLFWAMAAASSPFGQIVEPAARVPSAIAGAMVLLLTFGAARVLFGNGVALLSILILSTTFRFWWQAHSAQIDMLLCACTTLTFYSLLRWDATRQRRYLFLLYGGVALGLLAKGPPALLIPALAIAMLYRRDVSALKGLKPGWGVPAAVGVFLLWFIPSRLAAEGDGVAAQPGIGAEFRRQIVERILAGGGHVRPIWYYFKALPLDWLPWILFAPWVIAYAWQHRRDAPMRFLLCWIVPSFIFFSVISTKREVYLVPLYPAMAIVVAAGLYALTRAVHVRMFAVAPTIWLVLLGVVSGAPFILLATPYADAWTPRLMVFTPLALVCLGWTVWVVGKREWPRLPTAMAAQSAILLLAAAVCVFPVANQHKSSRDFMDPVRIIARSGGVNVYSAAFVREEYVYYSGELHAPVLVDPGVSALEPALGARGARELAHRLPGLFARAAESLCQSGTCDRPALLYACKQAAIDAGMPPECYPTWISAVIKEIEPMMNDMSAEVPIVLVVSEAHWPWVAALMGDASDVFVLSRERVTSRDMMLLGNRAAVDALDRHAPDIRRDEGLPAGSSVAPFYVHSGGLGQR